MYLEPEGSSGQPQLVQTSKPATDEPCCKELVVYTILLFTPWRRDLGFEDPRQPLRYVAFNQETPDPYIRLLAEWPMSAFVSHGRRSALPNP